MHGVLSPPEGPSSAPVLWLLVAECVGPLCPVGVPWHGAPGAELAMLLQALATPVPVVALALSMGVYVCVCVCVLGCSLQGACASLVRRLCTCSLLSLPLVCT
jgi:hypothetical protein